MVRFSGVNCRFVNSIQNCICCCQTYVIYKPPIRAEFTLRPNTIFFVTTSKIKYVSLYVCLYLNVIKSPFNPIYLAAVQALFS